MSGDLPLPAFQFRQDQPSLLAMFRQGIGDVSLVIPAAILEEGAVRLPGPGAPLVVAAPELVRQVLNDRADHFTRDRFVRRLFRRSWGKGLAGAEGEAWQRQRRAAVPFFTPRSVREHLGAFAAAADAVVDELRPDQELDLPAFSARIVARVVLGVLVDGEGLADPDAAARDVPPYVNKLAHFAVTDLLPLPERLIDAIRGIDRDPAVQRIREMSARLAQARRQGGPRQDLIALLEGEGPVEDNIRGLFPAAMDTTVAGLGWAFHLLALHGEWQDRVAAEGLAMGDKPDLEQLPATRAVVNEVLRLYPPAPLLARCAGQTMELGGHQVRKGQTLIVALYAMHRHRRHWARPDHFEPDRWLDGAANPDAFMPFGTGGRMCIAAHFAQAEMAVILARVLARRRIEPSGPAPLVSLRVTTRPVNGTGARALLRTP